MLEALRVTPRGMVGGREEIRGGLGTLINPLASCSCPVAGGRLVVTKLEPDITIELQKHTALPPSMVTTEEDRYDEFV